MQPHWQLEMHFTSMHQYTDGCVDMSLCPCIYVCMCCTSIYLYIYIYILLTTLLKVPEGPPEGSEAPVARRDLENEPDKGPNNGAMYNRHGPAEDHCAGITLRAQPYGACSTSRFAPVALLLEALLLTRGEGVRSTLLLQR